jgi:hypothetical protein
VEVLRAGEKGSAGGRALSWRLRKAAARAGGGGGRRRPTPLGVGNNKIDYCLNLKV